MTTVVASLVAEFGADISGYKQGSAAVKRDMSDLSRRMGDRVAKIGDAFSSVGRNIGVVAAPLGLALGVTIKSAIQFDTAMTDVQAVLGATNEEMRNINAQVLALGRTSIAGPQAAAEAFLEIVGGVEDASTHMAILEMSMKTAEAGAADLGATTSAMVSIMNAYGFAADDAAMVSDVLTRTVGMGVLTMDELAAAMPTVTGIAASMGVEFSELGGMMALITTKGFSASTAATQIQAAMVALIKPTADMTKAFDELGVASGAELIDKFGGLQGALEAITNTEVYAEQGAGALFGRVEALNSVIVLTDESSEGFLDEFTAGVEGATDAARAIQLEGAAAQFALLKSEVSAVAIEIGTVLLPMFREGVTSLRPLVAEFGAFAAAHPEVIQKVGLLTVGLIGLSSTLMALGPVIKVIGALIGVLNLPILVGIGLIAAYAGNFGGLRDAINQAGEGIRTGNFTMALDGIIDSLTAIPLGIAETVGAAAGIDVPSGLQAWVNILSMIQAGFQWIIQNPAEAFKKLYFEVPGGLNDFLGVVSGSVSGLGWIIDNAGKALTGEGVGQLSMELNAEDIARLSALTEPGLEGIRSETDTSSSAAMARAAGGVAMGGVPTWVGERGPELFIPSHTGSVIPAHRAGGMAGGGGQTINIDQVHLHGVQNPAQMLDSLERMAFRRNQRVQQPA
jgi:TP901 family phage tail tape measure protein